MNGRSVGGAGIVCRLALSMAEVTADGRRSRARRLYRARTWAADRAALGGAECAAFAGTATTSTAISAAAASSNAPENVVSVATAPTCAKVTKETTNDSTQIEPRPSDRS